MTLKELFKTDLLKNMSSLALIQAGSYLIPLFIIPYISRVIGIENYGHLEYSRTLIAYFTILINFGFNLTATREISINRHNKKKLKEIVTAIYFSKFILLLIAIGIFIALFQSNYIKPDEKLVLKATFLIVIGDFLIPMWFFQGIEKIAKIAYINFFIKLLFLGGVIFFINTPDKYWLYNLALSLAQISFGIYTVYVMIRQYDIQIVNIKPKQIIEKYKEGFNVFFSTILVTVFVTYPFLLLKESGTDLDVGSYSSAIKLASIIQVMVLLPFSQAFFPHITKKADENIVSFESNILKALKYIVIITFVLAIIAFVLAKWIIIIIYGKDYLSAIPPFRVLVFLPMFAVITNLFSYQGLLSLRKDRIFLRIHLFFAVLIIAVSYWIVPKFGVMGVSYIRVISEIALMSVSGYFFFKFLKKVKHEQAKS